MKQSKIRKANRANWQNSLAMVNGETCPELKKAIREMLSGVSKAVEE